MGGLVSVSRVGSKSLNMVDARALPTSLELKFAWDLQNNSTGF